jgi:hypothetical protein
MRRELARHRQTDLARLAERELLLADVALPSRMAAIDRLSARLGKMLPSLTRRRAAPPEQAPDTPVEIEGPA